MTKRTVGAIRRSMRAVVAAQPGEYTMKEILQRIANWERELEPAPGEKTEEQKAEEAGW